MVDDGLKTSQQWQAQFGCMVYDPDGWDRGNYEYSWYEERISESEFKERVSNSTTLWLGSLKLDS